MIPKNSICDHLFLVHLNENLTIHNSAAMDGTSGTIPEEAIDISTFDDYVKSLKPDKVKSILDRL